ncbi:hypothetical protein GIB67_034575 [Kingdonia uniflora]|uniref:Polygalacturonase n=1 Tax=Kingdonia uniflora TaxID=39325 RepID=A0A7J7MXK9_9MAGN|nr:hypothetical protein GIB67_034575 [Kingdonia uniflora]
MVIPKRTYLLNPVKFSGPCKSPNVHVQLQGTIVAPSSEAKVWAAYGKDAWIIFTDVNNLLLDGFGSIDGKGNSWWTSVCNYVELEVHFNGDEDGRYYKFIANALRKTEIRWGMKLIYSEKHEEYDVGVVGRGKTTIFPSPRLENLDSDDKRITNPGFINAFARIDGDDESTNKYADVEADDDEMERSTLPRTIGPKTNVVSDGVATGSPNSRGHAPKNRGDDDRVTETRRVYQRNINHVPESRETCAQHRKPPDQALDQNLEAQLQVCFLYLVTPHDYPGLSGCRSRIRGIILLARRAREDGLCMYAARPHILLCSGYCKGEPRLGRDKWYYSKACWAFACQSVDGLCLRLRAGQSYPSLSDLDRADLSLSRDEERKKRFSSQSVICHSFVLEADVELIEFGKSYASVKSSLKSEADWSPPKLRDLDDAGVAISLPTAKLGANVIYRSIGRLYGEPRWLAGGSDGFRNNSDIGGKYQHSNSQGDQIANALISVLRSMGHDVNLDVPEFDGKSEGDGLMDWLCIVDKIFAYKRYADPKSVMLIEMKLASFTRLQRLRQQQRSVDGYASDFYLFSSRVATTETESQKISHFKERVTKKIRDELTMFHIYDLAEVVEMAKRVETKLQGVSNFVPTHKSDGALKFINCNRLRIKHVNFFNSPKSHLVIDDSKGVAISDLRITAPWNSPNTDGIDIKGSINVQIHDCTIAVGDDCVAINGGSSFINISRLICGPGHGISVGSLGGNGAYETVEEIHVTSCNISNTMFGARIKTWQGGSGYARKITFEHIRLKAVANPIQIDQYYCPDHGCRTHGKIMEIDVAFNTYYVLLKLMIWVLIKASAVRVSDVYFNDVTGTSSRTVAIDLSCSTTVGCTNIVMNRINIGSTESGTKTISECTNAHGVTSYVSPAVPCLSSRRVS